MLIDTEYCSQTEKKCYIVVYQNKALLITVLLLLSLVGNRDLSKSNAIAIGNSLRAVNCLNEIVRI